MKKLFNKTKLAATLCMIAAILFSVTIFAQKNVTLDVPTCCGNPGPNQTITTCGGTVTLGSSTTVCPNSNCGYLQSQCAGTWSWAPVAGLSCTTCPNPTLTGSCTSGNVTYTMSITCPDGGSNAYTVTVYNQGCCRGCCRIGHFPKDDGEVESADVKIFPNPTTGKITVQLGGITTDMLIEVYDESGSLVLQKTNLTEKTMELDLSRHPKGIYFIQVVKGENGIVNKKIIRH